MKAKELSFIVLMGAMGNVLGSLTIAPTIFKNVALDFSALPVLVAAVFAGPLAGAVTGLIAGLLPSLFFGFIGGSLGLLGFSLSVGKALHGLTVGLVVKALGLGDRSTLTLIPVVLIGFIPEALWIIATFSLLVPLFLPGLAPFMSGLWAPILIKATFEVTVMAFFTSTLGGHKGFRAFITTFKASSA